MIGIYKIVMRLFISYSRDDKMYVYKFVDTLRDETRHEVWIDKEIVGGERWWDAILNEVEVCDCFITVLTPRCINSIYCSAELDYALALQKPILPLLLKPCDGMMPPSLQPIQFIDIESISLEKAIIRAIDALSKVEVKIIQYLYPPPTTKPPRPPTPKANAPQHSWEIFAAAEEAAATPNQFALAEQLFEQVIKADPKGIGVAATERLAEIRFERERETAYQNVVRLAANPVTLKGAQAAWRAFVAQYGNAFPMPDGLTPPPKIDFSKAVHDVIGGPFEWIDIPGGLVVLEEVEWNYSISKWVAESTQAFSVPTFAIAGYPITNNQYESFVKAKDGYENPTWWNYSDEAKQWRANNQLPKETVYPGNDLPRTNVNWYDAVAFCHWLAHVAKQDISLPTEQQWQRAALGDTRWLFPWGNEPPDKNRCNFAENVKQTSSVTMYPNGASFYGVMDMCGNVWEWCLNQHDMDNIALFGSNRRVVRGGSWCDPNLRTTMRPTLSPDLPDRNLGFRVARSL